MQTRPTRARSLNFVWTLSLLPVLSSVACGGQSSGNAPPTPASLVSTCSSICDQLATCNVPQTVHTQCLNDCQYLNLVQSSCIADLASYLTCLTGVTSIMCQAGGQAVVVTPPSCATQQQSYLSCYGGPPLAACVDVSTSTTACGVNGAPQHALICVGLPAQCSVPASTGLFGPYCCP
jgi:hypothetical protein